MKFKKTIIAAGVVAIILIALGFWVLPVWHTVERCFSPDPNKLDEKIEACTALIKRGSSAADYYQRGIAYGVKHEYDLAIQDQTEVLRFKPKDVSALVARGNAYEASRAYDNALQDFNLAINLAPNFGLIYADRGTVYQDQKQYDRAIQDFDQAINLNPNEYIAYSRRGATYVLQGQDDKANQDLDRALQLKPDDPLSLAVQGDIYVKQAKFNAAIKDYDLAIQQPISDSRLFFMRGMAKFLSVSPLASIDDFKTAVQISPTTPKFVIWLYLARIRANQNDQAEFEQNSIGPFFNLWDASILSLYSRQISPADLAAKAKNGDAEAQSHQNCEASFYLAELYWQTNMKDVAENYFQFADQTCPASSFIEREAAYTELGRLKANSP